MNHPLHSWDGVSKELTSVILTDANRNTISQVAVTARIASFDSQNANRDSHAIEATEALKFPNIGFMSKSIEKDGDKLKVSGTLTFHGVAKAISFEAIQKNTDNKIAVEGGFIFKMTDFKIDPPSIMGFATDDDVKIAFKVVY